MNDGRRISSCALAGALARRAAASASILLLAFCGGCASDDPTWNAIRGDWSVFTGAPAWIEREFERSGAALEQDGRWIAGNIQRNAETTAALPEDLRALAEEDFRKSGEGLAFQGRVIGRHFDNNVASFESDILGAPGWVGREFRNSGRELGGDFERMGARIERQANEFWPEFKRYLRALLR